jgi:hypothetical protein
MGQPHLLLSSECPPHAVLWATRVVKGWRGVMGVQGAWPAAQGWLLVPGQWQVLNLTCVV